MAPGWMDLRMIYRFLCGMAVGWFYGDGLGVLGEHLSDTKKRAAVAVGDALAQSAIGARGESNAGGCQRVMTQRVRSDLFGPIPAWVTLLWRASRVIGWSGLQPCCLDTPLL